MRQRRQYQARICCACSGVATQANIDWLIEHKYRYLVVRRGGVREFDAGQSVATQTVGGETVRLQKVLSVDGLEVELHCHSVGQVPLHGFADAGLEGLGRLPALRPSSRSRRPWRRMNPRIAALLSP